MAQRPAEGVARAQAVDHLDLQRRDLYLGGAVGGEHAVGALLDHRHLDAAVEQGAGGRLRLAHAHRGVALVEVADRHGHVRQRLLDPVPRLLAGGPEDRAVVEVEHGHAGPGSRFEGLQRGAAARLGGQPGHRHPEHPG